MRRPILFLRRFTFDKAAPYVGAAFLVCGVGYGAFYQHQGADSAGLAAHYGSVAATYGRENSALIKKGNRSQIQHHKQTVKTDAELERQNKEILAGEVIIQQGATLLVSYHADTVNSFAEVTALTTEIKTVQDQVADVINGLPGADKALAGVAAALEDQIQTLCAAVHASCPAVTLPS